MSSGGWRTTSLVLGMLCLVLVWRDCRGTPEEIAAPDRTDQRALAPRSGASGAGEHAARSPEEPRSPAPAATASGDGIELYGFSVPPWALWLAPHPGEDLRDYRDRMLPLAQAAIAPQRARVARSRDSFASLAHLDARQRATLDATAQDTASALQERVMSAVLNGEVSPATFKPMIGVDLARDLLDIVGRGNRRFLDSLDEAQRQQLSQHPFDFGDYLVFSTRWEDALKLFGGD